MHTLYGCFLTRVGGEKILLDWYILIWCQGLRYTITVSLFWGTFESSSEIPIKSRQNQFSGANNAPERGWWSPAVSASLGRSQDLCTDQKSFLWDLSGWPVANPLSWELPLTHGELTVLLPSLTSAECFHCPQSLPPKALVIASCCVRLLRFWVTCRSVCSPR